MRLQLGHGAPRQRTGARGEPRGLLLVELERLLHLIDRESGDVAGVFAAHLRQLAR